MLAQDKDKPIYVNQTGRITKGQYKGMSGNVVGADWDRQIVQIEYSTGVILIVPWSYVEQ